MPRYPSTFVVGFAAALIGAAIADRCFKLVSSVSQADLFAQQDADDPPLPGTLQPCFVAGLYVLSKLSTKTT